jgi:hypothetical protein
VRPIEAAVASRLQVRTIGVVGAPVDHAGATDETGSIQLTDDDDDDASAGAGPDGVGRDRSGIPKRDACCSRSSSNAAELEPIRWDAGGWDRRAYVPSNVGWTAMGGKMPGWGWGTLDLVVWGTGFISQGRGPP